MSPIHWMLASLTLATTVALAWPWLMLEGLDAAERGPKGHVLPEWRRRRVKLAAALALATAIASCAAWSRASRQDGATRIATSVALG